MSSPSGLVGLKKCLNLLEMLCTKWNKSGGETILTARFVFSKIKRKANSLPSFAQNGPFWLSMESDRARHLAGTQAARASIHPARRTVYDCLHTLDVGFPSPVRAPVGVGNLNTKRHIFAAKFTFRHVSHLLFTRQIQNNRTILAGIRKKCKQFLTFFASMYMVF